MEITTLRIFRFWHHLDFMWKLYPMSRELDKCVKRFRDVTTTVIKKKMEEYQGRKSSLVAELEEGKILNWKKEISIFGSDPRKFKFYRRRTKRRGRDIYDC
ncbi:hypothetical protein NQ314_012884, partial [Rhamnusium bicolor]